MRKYEIIYQLTGGDSGQHWPNIQTSDSRKARRLHSTGLGAIVAAIFAVLVLGDENMVTAASSEQEVRAVPGTKWTAAVGTDGDAHFSPHIDLNVEDEVQVRFVFGSNGSLALVLRDKYMEAQISEVLGWTEGQSYRAVLFLDDKNPIKVQAVRWGQHSLLIPLASIDRDALFRTKHMSLQVGNIAMRGYDVDGLDLASRELLESYQQHRSKAPSKHSRQK